MNLGDVGGRVVWMEDARGTVTVYGQASLDGQGLILLEMGSLTLVTNECRHPSSWLGATAGVMRYTELNVTWRSSLRRLEQQSEISIPW